MVLGGLSFARAFCGSSGGPGLPTVLGLVWVMRYLVLTSGYSKHHSWADLQVPVAGVNFLEQDLDVPRLNALHDGLNLICQEQPPQPLQRQKLRGREVVVTEDVEMHLVFYHMEQSLLLLIKPMPRYLLDPNFWQAHLLCSASQSSSGALEPAAEGEKQDHVCDDSCHPKRKLHGLALGFMMSYVGLIQTEGDFLQAKALSLPPEALLWEHWVKLVKQLLTDRNRNNINKRYYYGEIPLLGLNLLCYTRGWFPEGYKSSARDYSNFLRRNTEGLFALFAFFAIVLTAMQVGLATPRLGGSSSFQDASWGFTVLSIVIPLVGVAFFGIGESILVVYRIWKRRQTWKKQKHATGLE
ncbi:hypothetical protein CC80DRAFT_505455 [Byssothecium circinans]|uniref:Uncharacterized protein n=1 Tax=Byssothecium circinans TaxID=147558 RepID=A0A6A5TT49_9PLEO|nr:hypothetical protein CC80DRAFT_505455 [Byssothecium circinans]